MSGSRRRHLPQDGYTLVEVLVGVAISLMILVPLTAWMVLAMRQQPATQDGLVRIASTGVLATYFPEDVAVAGAAATDEAMAEAADVNWEDCRNGGGAGGRRLLVLVRSGVTATKVVYTEAAATNDGAVDPTVRSIWRRECDASTGLGTTSAEVLEGVVPDAAAATCPVSADGVPCRQIELVVNPDGSAPVSLRGMRRVDTASIAPTVTGNRVPVAKIKVVSQAVRQPYEVVFSSADSRDPDGTIVCYEWSFPTVAEGDTGEAEKITVEVPADPAAPPGSSCPGGAGDPGDPGPSGDLQLQERTLPTPGVYYVELTVTDDKGVSSTTYKRVEIVPPDPVAAARVQPVGAVATAGETVLEFAARWYSEEDGREIGSEHPDGTIAEYEWTISMDNGGPDTTYVALRSTPDPWYLALPEYMAGNVTVTLTVSDVLGATSSAVVGLTLAAPDPPSEPPPADLPAGAHPAPATPGFESPTGPGSVRLVWAPADQVDRYLVQFSYSGTDCVRTVTRVLLPGPTPTQALYPNLCGQGGGALARVGTVLAGTVSWSGWIDAPVAAFWAPAPVEAGG